MGSHLSAVAYAVPGESTPHAAHVDEMSMRQYNRLWPESFEFAEPIRAAIDKNVMLNPKACLHPVEPRPQLDLASGTWKAQHHASIMPQVALVIR
jgi:hypothetical protein